jgi:hypothetical protein
MSFETPEAVAEELKLFTENDGDIYRQQTTSILRALATKKASGKYDREKAVDLFMYLTETGAKKYAKEFSGPGTTWHGMFPRDVRRLVAMGWRDEFEAEYANGAYDSMLPKKYQGLLGSKKLPSGPKTTKAKSGNTTPLGFRVGERVSMHPATDAFMMGDRYGEVSRIGKQFVHVRMDRSGGTRKVSPGNLEHVSDMDHRRL